MKFLLRQLSENNREEKENAGLQILRRRKKDGWNLEWGKLEIERFDWKHSIGKWMYGENLLGSKIRIIWRCWKHQSLNCYAKRAIVRVAKKIWWNITLLRPNETMRLNFATPVRTNCICILLNSVGILWNFVT